MNATNRFTLHDNGTVRLTPRSGGFRIRAERGVFIVTQEGDPEDHVLPAAGEFRTAATGLVVVWALSDGAFEVDEPRRRAA